MGELAQKVQQQEHKRQSSTDSHDSIDKKMTSTFPMGHAIAFKPSCPCDGGCPRCVQAKLAVSQPGDPYEQEADRVAEQIMSMTPADPYRENGSNGTGGIGGARHGDDEIVRRKMASSPGITSLQSGFSVDIGPGEPIDRDTVRFMESRFNHDFGKVRVHSGKNADVAAGLINANAYTSGQDIVFGEGKYAPGTQEGRKLLAHELAHTIQQSGQNAEQPGIVLSRAPAPIVQRDGEVKKEDPIDEAINQALQKYPDLEYVLGQVVLKYKVETDRCEIIVKGKAGKFVYPISVLKAKAGFYLVKWNAEGVITDLVDLETRMFPQIVPYVPIAAGAKEELELRKNSIGVIWFTQTVLETRQKSQQPEEMHIELGSTFEIGEKEFRNILKLYPPRPLIIQGVAGGIFDPANKGKDDMPGYYGRPLYFTYYTHTGDTAIVSRNIVGREFYYAVPISDIQNYLRIYPIEYGIKEAAPMVALAQMATDISLSFLPVVGPLYGLVLAGKSAYDGYQYWDKMSGWEKALLGATVLLSVVPVFRGASKAVRGIHAFDEGVESLMKAGLPRGDARRLMLAGGVFQSERATRQIVDNLGDVIRKGQKLNPAQIADVEKVFRIMLDRLPTAERAAIEASFATESMEKANEFFREVSLTERQLTGLRRLMPELLVVLRRVGIDEPIIVQRIGDVAARSQDVAVAIDKLYLALGSKTQRFLSRIVDNAGQDVLAQLGRGNIGISEELAAYVRNARNSTNAYERLMQGTTQAGRDIHGLTSQLFKARGPDALPESLESIQQEFSRTFLTASQLKGLSALDGTVREALRDASDAQLRSIASTAGRSSAASSGINQLSKQLTPYLKSKMLPNVIDHIGGGMMESLGKNGVLLSDDLIKEAARQSTDSGIAQKLLGGYMKKGIRIPGIYDQLAGKLGNLTDLEMTLGSLNVPTQQSNLFATWATRNPAAIPGINTVIRLRPADAYEKIVKIYGVFKGDNKAIADIFEAIDQVGRISPSAKGLDRMIGELAAGGEKTMGASLTLNYAISRYGGRIIGFEYSVKGYGIAQRDYDLFANGYYYEFKYWLGFGGRPAAAAADEFARDVIYHMADNFRHLRWVISKDAISSVPAIESMMRGVLARKWVQDILLKEYGISYQEAYQRLDNAIRAGMIEFF